MKKSNRIPWKTVLVVCLWACVMFAEELVRLALSRSAAPEDGIFRHIVYTLLYGGKRAKLLLFVYFLAMLALAAVQLRGYVQAAYTGTAPALGFASLVADGSGGLRVAGTGETGRNCLVVSVDTTGKTMGLFL